MVERDLIDYDAALAENAVVLPGLDVRLTKIDYAAGEDLYHVLQGLKDLSQEANPRCCYLYQRLGETGTRGQIQVDGPMEQSKVAIGFCRIFRAQTGAEHGTLRPGDQAKPKKFWLQAQATPDIEVRWQYYVSDGVDGKRLGWYNYDLDASEEVEYLFAQHVANEREGRTAARIISSGLAKYRVDLNKMIQINVKTRMVRTIRRVAAEELDVEHDEYMDESGTVGITAEPAGPSDDEEPPLKSWRAVPGAARAVLRRPAASRAASIRRRAASSLDEPKPGGRLYARSYARKLYDTPGLTLTVKEETAKAPDARLVRGTRAQVYLGKRYQTPGQLKQDDLVKNWRGRIISKKRLQQGKKQFKSIANWTQAIKLAREQLGITGFKCLKKGEPLYVRAKELLPNIEEILKSRKSPPTLS